MAKKKAKKAKAKPKVPQPPTVNYVSVPPDVALQHARNAVRKHRADLEKIAQVRGVGVGRRIRESQVTDEWAIQVICKSAKEKAELVADAKAGKNALRAYLEGVPVDVIVLGDLEPASGGSQITSPGASGPGTLGIDVYDLGLNQYWLTAAHVVEKSLGSSIGGQAVKYKSGKQLGTVQSGVRDNLADFALIAPDNPSSGLVGFGASSGAPHDPKGALSGMTADQAQHGRVWKIGAKTGFTEGTITNIDLPKVDMKNGEVVNDPIIISAGFAQQGDSGAVIVSSHDQKIIGLVRAVDLTSGFVVAGDIKYVVDGPDRLALFR